MVAVVVDCKVVVVGLAVVVVVVDLVVLCVDTEERGVGAAEELGRGW